MSLFGLRQDNSFLKRYKTVEVTCSMPSQVVNVQPTSKMRVQQFGIREDTLFPYCRVWKWVGGRGYTYKSIKKESQITKKELAT